MGANLVMNYLGQRSMKINTKTRIRAAVAISPPYDLKSTCEVVTNNWFIRKGILVAAGQTFKRQLASERTHIHLRNQSISLGTLIVNKIDEMRNFKTIHDLDEIMRKTHNYATLEEYYKEMSAINYMQHITIPLLSVNSLLDPLMDSSKIPRERFEENQNLFLITLLEAEHITYPHTCANINVRDIA